jgi:hypothetical protein
MLLIDKMVENTEDNTQRSQFIDQLATEIEKL